MTCKYMKTILSDPQKSGLDIARANDLHSKKIKMLARDPISRTQTALIDMYTKGEAEKASYIMGSIFGLVVKISLATEGD